MAVLRRASDTVGYSTGVSLPPVPALFARLPKPLAVALTVLGILVVGEVDFWSGVELRIYPLYYLPISFAAWYLGRVWTVAAVGLSALAWATSNYLAGLHFSAPGIWLFNTVMLIASSWAWGFSSPSSSRPSRTKSS